MGMADMQNAPHSRECGAFGAVSRVRGMARELPDRLSDEIKIMRRSGLNHKVMDSLAVVLPERATRIATL